jgi:hypothetical protein
MKSLSRLNIKIKEEILIYCCLLKFSLRELEKLCSIAQNGKDSILKLYWFDLSSLFTLERLNERVGLINGSVYVYYDDMGYQYNPLTEAFYALIMYQRGKYGLFLKLVENLIKKSTRKKINNQDIAFWYYPFPFPPRVYKTQWISGMTQGVIASTMCRAYYLTHIDLYKSMSIEAINGMLTPIEYGGALYKDNHWLWIEEVPDEKPLQHIFNGFIYSLLGLYDTYLVTNDPKLLRTFRILLLSLKLKIRNYDLVLWSKYDVTRMANTKYHFVHIVLLYTFYKLTNDDDLKNYSLRWMRGLKNPLFVFIMLLLRILVNLHAKSKNMKGDIKTSSHKIKEESKYDKLENI